MFCSWWHHFKCLQHTEHFFFLVSSLKGPGWCCGYSCYRWTSKIRTCTELVFCFIKKIKRVQVRQNATWSAGEYPKCLHSPICLYLRNRDKEAREDIPKLGRAHESRKLPVVLSESIGTSTMIHSEHGLQKQAETMISFITIKLSC